MVELKVGTNDQIRRFTVHKKLLCDKIPYFQIMFGGPWKEANEYAATFPEEDPESFDLLLSWVYSGTLR